MALKENKRHHRKRESGCWPNQHSRHWSTEARLQEGAVFIWLKLGGGGEVKDTLVPKLPELCSGSSISPGLLQLAFFIA